MASQEITGQHTCFICKTQFSWTASLAKTSPCGGQAEVVVASTFHTVDQGQKADLEIYAKCPSCQTKYKFESSCPLELMGS
ncbi:hypothetical protein [Ammoniphilus sp. 3BR4]|uniref:hypothetical protein n=1 Tax=Ammoniphilus sp. 3BR4 TaxID=3158265 RepID=UPI003465101C